MTDNQGASAPSTLEYREPTYRFNLKQSAKGELYGEFTVRGDNADEVAVRAAEMLSLLKKHSTVGVE